MATILTPRLKYPTPTFLTDPWFDDITAFFLGVDGTNWAVAEDRNLFTHGGGTLTLDGVLNTLTWTMPIYLQTFSVGISWRLEANTITIFPARSSGCRWTGGPCKRTRRRPERSRLKYRTSW